MQTRVWYRNNDMQAEISGVRSSTMASTAYLNSSTGMRVSIWETSTASTAFLIINNRTMSYVAASNGAYRATVQSTEHGSLALVDVGVAIFTLNHSGLNGQWRAPFRVEDRGTS